MGSKSNSCEISKENKTYQFITEQRIDTKSPTLEKPKIDMAKRKSDYTPSRMLSPMSTI